MKVDGSLVNIMVNEHGLPLVDTSMMGNGRMGLGVVKEHRLTLMEESMRGVGKMELDGTEHHTKKTEKFTKSM